MVEYYKFVGEDGVDSDVPCGRIVRFECGRSKDADHTYGVWRDAETGRLNGQSFEHSSLIPYRAKFKTFDGVYLKEEAETGKRHSICGLYCNLTTGEWLYTLNTGAYHKESKLVGVPKAPAERSNVVEKCDIEARRNSFTSCYGGDFSTSGAATQASRYYAHNYVNWGPIRGPFREVQAGQQIQAGQAVASDETGRAVQLLRWLDMLCVCQHTFQTLR